MQIGVNGLIAEGRGEIELEDDVLIIKRIHVIYRLTTRREDKEKVDRAYGLHAEHCPVYRSLYRAIDVTTELNWQEE